MDTRFCPRSAGLNPFVESETAKQVERCRFAHNYVSITERKTAPISISGLLDSAVTFLSDAEQSFQTTTKHVECYANGIPFKNDNVWFPAYNRAQG